MKWYVPALLALLLTASTGFAADKATLKTDEQKCSYAMGMDLGKYLKSLEEKFDLNLLQKGINDGYSGEKQLLTDEEAMTIQQDFAKRQREKQIKKTVETIQKNRKEADDFLSANMKKEGVQATKSGLQYKVITMGTGSKPKPGILAKSAPNIIPFSGIISGNFRFNAVCQAKSPLLKSPVMAPATMVMTRE